MINTLYESTSRYLELLTNSGEGVQRHPVEAIQKIPQGVAWVDSQTWPLVCCQLPAQQRFPSDSAAELKYARYPGMRVRARIQSYDSLSGRTELAVEEVMPSESGELVIDFKWLVQRQLEWVRTRGSDIKNPFLCNPHPSKIVDSISEISLFSEEQCRAVRNLLENPVGYVWGPPGTGKTRRVLAELVAHLCRNDKKVLVVAPTNLAVDNALDAILSVVGDVQSKVLRIGLPSKEFGVRWPKNCEQQAFKAQLADLVKRLKLLIERKDAVQRRAVVEELIVQFKVEVETHALEVERVEQEMSQLRLESEATSARFSEVDAKCQHLVHEVKSRQEALEVLNLDFQLQQVVSLEREQMNLIALRQQCELQLSRLRWWERCFTKRKAQLHESRDNAARRLESVESTLVSQRRVTQELDVRAAEICDELEKLKSNLEGQEESLRKLSSKSLKLSSNMTDAANRAATIKQPLAAANVQLTACRTELGEVNGQPELPQNQLAMMELFAEIETLESTLASIRQDVSDKRVLGMTLDGFIGYTSNQAVAFDHVVVDEAGYAPLAKVMPLCSLNCPISLMGDHLQLPPVYQGKDDQLSECYWGTSALYLEEAFEPLVGNDPGVLLSRAQTEPSFAKMNRSVLTRSFRFGTSLASMLDRHFYRMGLTGSVGSPTRIELVNCPPILGQGASKQENTRECEMVEDRVETWLNWMNPDKGTLAILTPYRKQCSRLRRTLRRTFGKHPDFRLVEILTVHRAQGREWDTVFFSAVDTGYLPGNRPFLADTASFKGRLVVNTAISRAKYQLRIFMDCRYWAERTLPPSLLNELAVMQRTGATMM